MKRQYYYTVPFSIVKEGDAYQVFDVLGGRWRFEKRELSRALTVCGECTEDVDARDGDSLKQLIELDFLIPTKHKRKDSFNYKKIIPRIENGEGQEGSIMNVGSVTFALFRECPYNCRNCLATPSMTRKADKYPRNEDIARCIKDISLLGANNVVISGGEPTFTEAYAQKSVAIARMTQEEEIEDITMITTGFNLYKFRKLLFKSPISCYQISLDGQEEYNDSYKSFNGATNRSLRAISLCRESDKTFNVNAVVTRKNLRGLEGFIELMETMGVKDLRLARVITSDKEFALTSGDAKELHNIAKDKTKKRGLSISTPFDHCYIQKEYINCVAGKLYSHIDCNGNVLPCSFMPDAPMGNIIDSKFTQIWNTKNQPINLVKGEEIDGNCRSCSDRFYCFGNCLVEHQQQRSTCPLAN